LLRIRHHAVQGRPGFFITILSRSFERRREMVRTLCLLLLASATVWACGPDDIQASTFEQPLGPVRWGSMPAGGPDFASGTLMNTTGKSVVAVQGGWVMFTGCTGPSHAAIGDVKKVAISPNSWNEVSLGVYENDLRNYSESQGADKLWILVGIVHVDFADGTSWNHDLKSDPSFGDDAEYLLFKKYRCVDYSAALFRPDIPIFDLVPYPYIEEAKELSARLPASYGLTWIAISLAMIPRE
jgi:hypothetical protein